MVTFSHAEEGDRIPGNLGVAPRLGDPEEVGGDGEGRASARRRDGEDHSHGGPGRPGSEEGEEETRRRKFLNLTFFLGAGFSAAFGHPVMDTFLGFADGCKRLTDDDRNFLGRLVLEARRANSFLESSPTNLEDILSFSEMGDRLGLTSKDENRNSRLRSIVQKVYTTIPSTEKYWDKYKQLATFLGVKPCDFKGSLSFVTTNYDLNIECACWILGTQVDPGFVIRREGTEGLNFKGQFYETGGTPLFKLHGSVNWYPDNAEPGITVEDHIVISREIGDGGSSLYFPRPCFRDYEGPTAPVIIPPSFLKPDLQPALKAVWSGAAKVLSTANVVAFVGYSFPSSDTEMMYFLARALAENAGLRAVYIIDPRADAIRDRLQSAGSKMGSHFRELIRSINSKWELASGPRLLDPPS